MNVRHTLSSRRVRHWLILVCGQLAAIATTLVLFPHPVAASCGVTDPGACINDAQYSLWQTSAGMAWQIDSMLLALSYQLARLRYELVQTIFTSAYDALTTFVSPLIIPMATLALLVGVIALFLVPLLGHSRLVNIRHVVVWAVLAPLLLTQSGDILVQLDTYRTTIAQDIFTQVGTSTSVSPNVFGPQASDLPDAKPLYPASPCRGGGTITRPPGSPAIGVDSLAAAVAWANAGDIWCPQDNDPSPTFPDAFTKAPPDGPGWALESGHPGDYEEPQSSTYVQGMQQGSTRLWLAIIPCVLAVLDSLVQLLFSLSMIALWVGLPLALVTVFFQSTAAGVTMLARRVVTVFQISWSCSILLGIVFIALSRAIQLHNVAAYVGFATGAIFLYTFVLWTAGSTFVEALQTLRTTIAVATGLDAGAPVRQAQQVIGTAAGVGAAVATGGASVALAGGAAALAGAAGMAQTGSGVYAASAAIGRVSPTMMQLGEVAAALGYADPQGEVVRGLEAGQMGAHTTQQMRRRMHEDAKIKDDAGETYGQRAEGRSIRRAIEQVPQASATSAVRYDPENGVQFTEPVPQRFADHAASSRSPVYREAESDVDTARLTQMGYTWQRDAGRVRFWQEGDGEGANNYTNGDGNTDSTSAGTNTGVGTPLEQAAERAAERVRLIEAGAISDDLEQATRLRDATQAAAQAQASEVQQQVRAAQEQARVAQQQARDDAEEQARAAQEQARVEAQEQASAALAQISAAQEQTRVEAQAQAHESLEQARAAQKQAHADAQAQTRAAQEQARAIQQQARTTAKRVSRAAAMAAGRAARKAAASTTSVQEQPEGAPPVMDGPELPPIEREEVLPPVVPPSQAQPQTVASAVADPSPKQGGRRSATTESTQQPGGRASVSTQTPQAQQAAQPSVVSQELREERKEVLPPVYTNPATPQAQQTVVPTIEQKVSTTSTTAPAQTTNTSEQKSSTTSTTAPAQTTDTLAVAEASTERVATAQTVEQRVAVPAPPAQQGEHVPTPPAQRVAVPAPPKTAASTSQAEGAASSHPSTPVEDNS